MTQSLAPADAALPPDLARRLEETCDRFEAAWTGERPPRIEDFLTGWVEPGRSALTRELVQLDLYYHNQRGETCRPAEYLARIPGLDTDWLAAAIAETISASAGADRAGTGSRGQWQNCLPGNTDGQWAAAECFQPGRTFGNYELIEMVARGGMGIVFKAREKKLDRVVALKMILAGRLASPADVQRFRTESQAAARLDHPGIVPVYEVGECQGLHYFTMAFVDGTSLAERLRDGPLDPRQAARLIRDLSAAIQFAHDNGVVHRDLKPGNVLIDKAGQPKLTDFGLAKRTDRASDATGTGQILGTPGYMAPEQTEENRAAVGPAADVYGLGALLFALLTGRPPFQAATVIDTLLHVMSVDPPRPMALNPAVPRDLETICLKCLEKLPGKRYASAGALGNDLDRFLTDRPILARPVGLIERAYRWCRRRPVIGAMAAALATLAIAVPLLLAGLLAQAQDRVRTEVDAREKVQVAEQARTRQLFDALVNEAAARRSSPRVGRGFQTLDRIAAARDLADELKLPAEEYTRLRSEAIGALSLFDIRKASNGPGWLVRRDPEWCRYVNATDYYLAWDNPGNLLVRRVGDDQIIHRIPVPSTEWNANRVWLSPDNRFVSSLAGDHLVVWQVDGEMPREQLRRADVIWAVFAPDQPEITVYTRADELVVQPLAGAAETKTVNLLKLTGEPRLSAYWMCLPGPRRLVAVPGAKCVRVIDMNAGRIAAKFDMADTAENLAWSPDGGTLAAMAGHDGSITSFDLHDRISQVFKGSPGGPAHLAFSPSGRYLLAANAWTSRNVVMDAITGTAELRFHSVELDRDGDARAKLGWWQAAAENIHRVVQMLPEDGPGSAGECAIHPGGQVLATPTARGIVLSDLATGRRLGFLAALGGCHSPRFDAAGNLYAVADHRAVRWPTTAVASQIRIGPSERLNLPPGENLDISSDGRFVAQGAINQSAVLDRQTGKLIGLAPQTDVRHVAVQPDGSLVASFGFGSAGFRVSKTDSGESLEVGGTATNCAGGFFTPDGRCVITWHLFVPQLQLWSIPDCKPVRELGPAGSFGISPDSRYVAVAEANGKVRITRISDGSLIARFDAPGEEYIDSVTFGPGGRHLVGMNADRTRQHVWDLWQLRRRLAEMKLDWETEPAPDPIEPHESISVEIAAH